MKAYLVLEKIGSVNNYVELRVKHQVFRENSFFNTTYTFTASNGIRLASISHPANSAGSEIIYLRGIMGEKDNIVFRVLLENFEKIKIAVKEYNINMNEVFANKESELVF